MYNLQQERGETANREFCFLTVYPIVFHRVAACRGRDADGHRADGR